MARFVAGVVAGIVITTLAGAAVGIHAAEDLDRAVTIDTLVAANEAGVPLTALLGAMSSTGLPARVYLASVGELPAPGTSPPNAGAAPPQPPGAAPAFSRLDALVECLAWHESHGFAGAYNRRSGASGPLQFLPSTFATTPQGKAGLSPFDPVAARAAAKWMIGQGRLKEWATWSLCA
ncbi:MAG TPA: hypothetical protein VGJ60_16665 [Chloroflexota bacterium]|jgi:hypothetical protein